MTTRDALLAAILAHPDDDLPRLAFADWLEEDGDPGRAAFVRNQVELARRPEHDPLWVQLRHHDRDAFTGVSWLATLPPLPPPLQWATPAFRRGFPAAVTSPDATAFVAHAEELFALAPVESLSVKVVRVGEADALSRCPWVSRLVRLELPDGVSAPVARRLFASPHLTRLAELHVGAMYTTSATAAAVAASPVVRHLTALSFRHDGRATGTLAGHLARLPAPLALRKLDLAGNRLTADAVRELVNSPAAAAVEDLDLSDNNLGEPGTEALTAGRLLALRSLRLHQTRASAPNLAEAEFLAGLRGLSLGGNGLLPSAFRVLADNPAAGGLCVLDLRDNRLGDSGASAAAGRPHFANLLHLDLAENGITDRGAAGLAESPHLGGLVCLDLYGNDFSEAAAARLRDRFADRLFL